MKGRKAFGIFIWLLLLTVTFGMTCYGEETVIFGPQQFTRGSGKPVMETVKFSSSYTGSGFILRIQNGDDQGNNRVSSADVLLNGQTVAKPSDFNQQVEKIERAVSLNGNNELAVELNSQPGSFITVTIYKPGGSGEEPVVSFWASSDTIQRGESTTLHWDTSDVISATIDQGIGSVELSGSIEVSPKKETTYTITVLGTNGVAATASVTIRIGDLSIKFTSPLDGETFFQPFVNLAGVVTNNSGGEIGVAVNGVPAILEGSEFFFNQYPLMVGVNEVTAVVTDSQGNTASATIMVKRGGEGYYFLLKTISESGVSPLEAHINIECNFDFQLPVLQSSGPGSVEIIEATENGYRVRITGVGVFSFSASVADPEGNTLSGALTIRLLDKTQMETILETKWDTMVEALNNGDVETAVSFFTKDKKNTYRTFFRILSDKLPDIIDRMNNIQPVRFSPYRIEYLLGKKEIVNGKSVTVFYSIFFVVDNDGIWKISTF